MSSGVKEGSQMVPWYCAAVALCLLLALFHHCRCLGAPLAWCSNTLSTQCSVPYPAFLFHAGELIRSVLML